MRMPLTREQFKRAYREKGHTGATLAYVWRLSSGAPYISRLAADLQRPPHFDDAVRGLIPLSRKERADILRRLKAAKPSRRFSEALESDARASQEEWGIGSRVVATQDYGDIAESDHGWVIRHSADEAREDRMVEVLMDDGASARIPLDQMQEFFVETGETR